MRTAPRPRPRRDFLPVESLESRICFDSLPAVVNGLYTGIVPWLIPHATSPTPTPTPTDTNDQIATAVPLGAIGDDRSASATLASATDVNLYSFAVQANQRVAFDLDSAAGGTLDGELRVFNAAGQPLAANDNGSAPNEGATNDSYVQYTFPAAGTFYVGVSGSGNAAYDPTTGGGDAAGSVGGNGAFTLHAVLTGGGGFSQISGTAALSGQTTPIKFERFISATSAVDPTVRTWVLVHGRNGNGHTTGLTNIANTIHAQFPQDQILTLDWSQAAASPTYFDTEQWLEPVGTAAAQLLADHGFVGTTLNFVGYSFGTYISGEAAKRLTGGVNAMALIDPPVDAAGGYDAATSLDFTAVSRFSLALHDAGGSVAPDHSASSVTPAKADEAIAVTTTTHGAIIALFNNLIAGTGAVSQRFQLSRFLAGTPGPWDTDRYSDTGALDPNGLYEALLSTTGGGSVAQSLTYVSAATGLQVTES